MWSWDAFFSFLTNPQLIQGAWTTIWLTTVSMVLALPLAVLVALGRASRIAPVRAVTGFYVWLMRGTLFWSNWSSSTRGCPSWACASA
ncbi:hypothetical protein ACRAWF_27075 [Streptomyces sp. L7]